MAAPFATKTTQRATAWAVQAGKHTSLAGH
jgi:hypothetical protein